MKPHQQRVVDEKSELDSKIEKLHDFIQRNPLFLSLDGEEQARLKHQYLVMAEYSSILGERISFFN
jgi:septum formation inhibitor MinC